jgi:hypothetical protein
MAEGWSGPGWSIVNVQRLGPDLAPLDDPQPVQAHVDDVTCHMPRWYPLGGGVVGLSWACGVLYYICAGCVPTEKLGIIALHPSDLVPASESITLKSATGAGGLYDPRFVRQGDDWFVYATLAFHAGSQPSLAALHCEPTSPAD